MDSFKISKEQYCDLMKLDRTNAVNLFVYLLANADDNGTLIVSIRKISSELCIGVQTVRTLLKHWYITHILTHQVTHQGSAITICDIESYRVKKKRASTPANTPTNTPKTIEERKADFAERLKPYLEKYGKDTLNNFYQYWTQVNDGGVKMLFEKQKAFQIPNRLATWRRNGYGSNEKLPNGMNLQNSKEIDYGKGLERFDR